MLEPGQSFARVGRVPDGSSRIGSTRVVGAPVVRWPWNKLDRLIGQALGNPRVYWSEKLV
ncbi:MULTISPECIES: hypothetical protein [unclassified Corynebacterium]|uniref:hypothetical protein n=1 Tax=unclassified Corynebacterium TaxID=2624378 RepID=UPI00114CF8BE|nr:MULTISPECIES: hypothetical protein [unclassified Corynebacterium]